MRQPVGQNILKPKHLFTKRYKLIKYKSTKTVFLNFFFFFGIFEMRLNWKCSKTKKYFKFDEDFSFPIYT